MTAGPILHFVTSNPHKAAEVESLLATPVQRIDLDLPEIQAGSLEEIVRAKLESARQQGPSPIAVEDVSLELRDLGGFPGPYVKWLIRSAGGDGLARLAAALPSPMAEAVCMVGLWDGRRVRIVEGRVSGQIVQEPRGSREFGWDAWFLPQGSGRTYGEMTRAEKAADSHRARAWKKV